MTKAIALPAIANHADRAADNAGFFEWWLEELAQMAGGRRQRQLRDPVIALCTHDGVQLAALKGKQVRTLGRLAFDPYDPTRLIEVEDGRLLHKLRHAGRSIAVRLDHHYGLVAHDILPAAAESELRAVIANRLDVLTPWSARQAYFDFRIVDRVTDPTGERRIQVEISVAPASVVEGLVDAFADVGLDIATMDIASGHGWGRPEIDLLGDNRPTRFPAWIKAGTFLGLAAVLCGSAVLGYEIYRKHQVLEEQRRFAGAMATRVGEMDQLKEDIEALAAQSTLMREARDGQPSVLNLVELLSRTLPDEVWLEGLELTGRDLSLSGYAASASDLVPLLETADGLQNVQFRSPSTRAVMSTADGSSFEAEQFRLGALVAADLIAPPDPAADTEIIPAAGKPGVP